MSFRTRKAVATEDVKYALINNSQTLSVGEVIIPAVQGDIACVSTGGGTTAGLLGVVLSVVGDKGRVLEVDTFAASASNVTGAKVKVAYVPMYRDIEFAVELDAAPETTDDSSAFGNFAVDATGLFLSESSYVAFGTVSAKQFFSYGLVEGTARTVTCRYMGGVII